MKMKECSVEELLKMLRSSAKSKSPDEYAIKCIQDEIKRRIREHQSQFSDNRNERCETCRFWMGPHPGGYDDNRGSCRRHAPTPLSIGNDEQHFGLWTWPMVCPCDFCGEWRPTE